MLIRQKARLHVRDEMRSRVGLIEWARYLFFFIDKQTYDHYKNNKSRLVVPIGKVIQLNLSVQKGGNNPLRSSNIFGDSLNEVNISFYKYTGVFHGGIENLDECELMIEEGFRSGNESDMNNKRSVTKDMDLYSTLINEAEQNSHGVQYNFFNDVDADRVLDPRYYTEKHQMMVSNDIVYVVEENPYTYTASDLVDDHTTIRVYDIKAWDTMQDRLRDQINDMIDDNKSVISTGLNIASAEVLLNGMTFIYDTQMGVNIKGGGIPLSKYTPIEKVVSDVKAVKNLFVSKCRDVEEEAGSIRVFYTPTIKGDKMTVTYKDRLDEETGKFGFHQKMSVDRGFTVKDIVTSHIQDMQTYELGYKIK